MSTKPGWVAASKAKQAKQAKQVATASAACLQGLLASMLVGVPFHENRLGTAASSRAIKPVAVKSAK